MEKEILKDCRTCVYQVNGRCAVHGPISTVIQGAEVCKYWRKGEADGYRPKKSCSNCLLSALGKCDYERVVNGADPCAQWRPKTDMLSLNDTISFLEPSQKDTCTDCTSEDEEERVKAFREHIQKIYQHAPTNCGGGFDEILCYELHSQPVNPRMDALTFSGGFNTGLTFKELASKWGVSIDFLGLLIADHCKRL